jgi:hypothetical protein
MRVLGMVGHQLLGLSELGFRTTRLAAAGNCIALTEPRSS